MGFASADTRELLTLRRNLLHGLDQVVEHAAAGTLHVTPAGALMPPAASGWLVVILLEQVEAELAARVPAAVVPAR